MALTILPTCSASPDVGSTGKVQWERSLPTGLLSSKKTHKPIFALFQEVPGCAGCRQFGREVLGNPLLVDIIEIEFVPLLIHNNEAGADAAVLAKYGEPAWNFQVVRFFNEQGQDLIPRQDRVWETGPLAARMIAALQAAKRPVPPALSLLEAEHSSRLLKAVFTMGCFWTGEMSLGQIEGVITTEAGFHQGREVTLVRYDPNVITLPKLITAAEKVACAQAVHVPAADLAAAQAARLKVGTIVDYRPAPSSDQKKQLQQTIIAKLNLQGAQATKVNAWYRVDAAKALRCLTANQLGILK